MYRDRWHSEQAPPAAGSAPAGHAHSDLDRGASATGQPATRETCAKTMSPKLNKSDMFPSVAGVTETEKLPSPAYWMIAVEAVPPPRMLVLKLPSLWSMGKPSKSRAVNVNVEGNPRVAFRAMLDGRLTEHWLAAGCALTSTLTEMVSVCSSSPRSCTTVTRQYCKLGRHQDRSMHCRWSNH